MTAIITLRQRDAVHVLSDAAVYHTDGVVNHFCHKTLCLPHLNAVIASRGPSQALDVINKAMARLYLTFDEMVGNVEGLLHRLCDEFPEQMACYGASRIDLFIAGWSEAENRPKSFIIISEDNDWRPEKDLGPGVELITDLSFKLTELTEISVAPVVDTDTLIAASEFGPSIIDVNSMNPETHGLMLLELQRQKRVALIEGDEPAHWVGGFALLSSVTANGITQKVIHRWPDEAGELIKPVAIDWKEWWSGRSERSTGKLTRVQRRAAAAIQRKAA